MISKILAISKGAASFLQHGVAPQEAPDRIKQQLEDTNHLSSKKFFIIFSSLLMLAFLFYTSVGILWIIPTSPEYVTAFVTIFSKVTEIFAVIISVYLGAQGIVDLKYNSSSSASIHGEVIVEKKEEILTHNTKEDDYDISKVKI
jgi:hypothetical protein